MSENLLNNGGFEIPWGDDKSHRVLVFPDGKDPYEAQVGEIFSPSGDWIAFFRHVVGTWDQPEVTHMHESQYPRRVCEGKQAIKLFTFHKRHDAGLMQQVAVERGVRLRLSAMAHAWSNHNDLDGYEWCADDGLCSAGVGQEAVFISEGEAPELCGDPWSDAIQNFTFRLGIDPTGGMNPYADTVVWGWGAHIYNEFAPVPEVEVVAEAEVVTVFLRSVTLFPFRHNDASWDDVKLEAEMYGSRYSPEAPLAGDSGVVMTIEGISREEVQADLRVIHESENLVAVELVGESLTPRGWHIRTWKTEPVLWKGRYMMEFFENVVLLEADFHIPDGVEAPEPPPPPPPLPDGLPRVQYARVYVLLPQGCGPEWAVAAVQGGHGHRFTVGYSADDAGLGSLGDKTVIAVNPHLWPDGLTEAWFIEYYPGTTYVEIEAATPEELTAKLLEM